jgi:hypothetical protein
LHTCLSREIASALKSVTEAVAGSSELAPKARADSLDQLQTLVEQAALPADKRAKRGVIGAVLSALGGTLASTAAVAEVWDIWGDQIRSYFGF